MQVLRGSGEWAAIAQPLLRLGLKVLDKLLGGSGPGVVSAQPRLTGSELEGFWCELALSVGFLSVLVGKLKLWGTQFSNTLDGMLKVVG